MMTKKTRPVEALDIEDAALLMMAIEAKLINRIPPKDMDR